MIVTPRWLYSLVFLLRGKISLSVTSAITLTIRSRLGDAGFGDCLVRETDRVSSGAQSTVFSASRPELLGEALPFRPMNAIDDGCEDADLDAAA